MYCVSVCVCVCIMQDSTTGPGNRDQHNMTRDSLTRTCPCPGTCGVPPKRTRANGVRAKKHQIVESKRITGNASPPRLAVGTFFFSVTDCPVHYGTNSFSGPVDFAAAVSALAKGVRPSWQMPY